MINYNINIELTKLFCAEFPSKYLFVVLLISF